jgi:hypothetical protein
MVYSVSLYQANIVCNLVECYSFSLIYAISGTKISVHINYWFKQVTMQLQYDQPKLVCSAMAAVSACTKYGIVLISTMDCDKTYKYLQPHFMM